MYAHPAYIGQNEDFAMQAFKDTTAEIDEKATERMHFRAKPHIKRAIQRARLFGGIKPLCGLANRLALAQPVADAIKEGGHGAGRSSP